MSELNDVRVKMVINFHSVHVLNLPENLKGSNCFLLYKRGGQQQQTKKIPMESDGSALFNFKFEMKTFFEVDKSTGTNYKEKMGVMTVYIRDNQEDKIVGSCSVNWANFVEAQHHEKQILMNDQLMQGCNPNSYIQLEIDTSEDKKTEQSPTKPSASKPKPQDTKARNPTLMAGGKANPVLEKLQQDIDKKKDENNNLKKENSDLKQDLLNEGYITLTTTDGADDTEQSVAEQPYTVDNSANHTRYENIKGFDTTDINLLCRLDEDILRQHEAVLRKRNKNVDMRKNKIAQLDDKPELSEYMFTKIGRVKLEEQLMELEAEFDHQYDIRM